jgi:hypothetical protein
MFLGFQATCLSPLMWHSRFVSAKVPTRVLCVLFKVLESSWFDASPVHNFLVAAFRRALFLWRVIHSGTSWEVVARSARFCSTNKVRGFSRGGTTT